MPEQTLDEAANCDAGEYHTMLRGNVKEMEPVGRAVDNGTLQ